MTPEGYWFTSSKFDIEPGEDEEINPRLYGRSLAVWLKERLYLEAGCASLFAYCTDVLHLSEHAAYGRIEAARASRRFPILLDGLANGSLTLTAVTLLAPHLTDANHRAVLAEARHLRKPAIQALVARLRPQPDVPTVVGKLPVPAAPPTVAAAPTPAAMSQLMTLSDEDAVTPPRVQTAAPRSTVVTPLAPERYKIQLTISRHTHDKLCRAQDLLRHAVPTGDVATIIDRALTLLVHDLERAKVAAVDHPRASRSAAAGSRHIPAAVRRAVWRRDEGRCAFVGTHGRCAESAFLEFHPPTLSSFGEVSPEPWRRRITSSHTPPAVPLRSRTSSSAVVRTTSTKRSSISIRNCRCLRGRRRLPTRSRPTGVPLHRIRDLLGHADISTTSRYLAVTPTELQRSMQMAEERQREQTRRRRSAGKQTRKHGWRLARKTGLTWLIYSIYWKKKYG